jgi:hypothetical protein
MRNPANALLNYLYAILEAEARIAILSMGLDPGMGVLHADLKARDSLPTPSRCESSLRPGRVSAESCRL